MDRLEEWKPIEGFENVYEVSNMGRIRRLLCKTPRIIKGCKGQYYRVQLCYGDNKRQARIHRLVLETFIGPCPPNMEAAHLNGNYYDNNLENLKWVTKKENHSHKWLHGTAQCGERASINKLKESQVLKIRNLRERGFVVGVIAEKFNISKNTIYDICTRKTWRHI